MVRVGGRGGIYSECNLGAGLEVDQLWCNCRWIFIPGKLALTSEIIMQWFCSSV